MLVQPSRTATVCEVDRARKRAASRKRAQNLGSRTNNRWRFITPKTIHLTLTCSCEACSAFTRVAARTLALSPIRDLLHRRLQPFRHLHDCSGCFRLERSPGGTCTHWKAPPSHGARKKRSLPDDLANGSSRLEAGVPGRSLYGCDAPIAVLAFFDYKAPTTSNNLCGLRCRSALGPLADQHQFASGPILRAVRRAWTLRLERVGD